MFNREIFFDYLTKLISIDSVSGFHEEIQEFVVGELKKLNITYDVFYKGGIVAHIGNNEKKLRLWHIWILLV